MPFKTKRQKLKAAARRYTLSAILPVNYQSPKVSKKNQDLPEKITEVTPQQLLSKQTVGAIEQDYTYVRTDLIKIAVLAGIIGIAQILTFLFLTG